eukprot:304131-Rhodomonas_salina.7
MVCGVGVQVVHVVRMMCLLVFCKRLKANFRLRLQTVVSVNKRYALQGSLVTDAGHGFKLTAREAGSVSTRFQCHALRKSLAGFRVWGSGWQGLCEAGQWAQSSDASGYVSQDSGFREESFMSKAHRRLDQGSGLRAQGSGLRAQGAGCQCRVQSSERPEAEQAYLLLAD